MFFRMQKARGLLNLIGGCFSSERVQKCLFTGTSTTRSHETLMLDEHSLLSLLQRRECSCSSKGLEQIEMDRFRRWPWGCTLMESMKNIDAAGEQRKETLSWWSKEMHMRELLLLKEEATTMAGSSAPPSSSSSTRPEASVIKKKKKKSKRRGKKKKKSAYYTFALTFGRAFKSYVGKVCEDEDPNECAHKLYIHGLFGNNIFPRNEDVSVPQFDDDYFRKNQEITYELLSIWPNLRNRKSPAVSYLSHHQGFWRNEYIGHYQELRMTQSEFFNFACEKYRLVGERYSRLILHFCGEYREDGRRKFNLQKFMAYVITMGLPEPTFHVCYRNGIQDLVELKFYIDYKTRDFIVPPAYRRKRPRLGVKKNQDIGLEPLESQDIYDGLEPLEPYNPEYGDVYVV